MRVTLFLFFTIFLFGNALGKTPMLDGVYAGSYNKDGIEQRVEFSFKLVSSPGTVPRIVNCNRWQCRKGASSTIYADGTSYLGSFVLGEISYHNEGEYEWTVPYYYIDKYSSIRFSIIIKVPPRIGSNYL